MASLATDRRRPHQQAHDPPPAGQIPHCWGLTSWQTAVTPAKFSSQVWISASAVVMAGPELELTIRGPCVRDHVCWNEEGGQSFQITVDRRGVIGGGQALDRASAGRVWEGVHAPDPSERA